MTRILERLGLLHHPPDPRSRAHIEADIEEELAAHLALRALDNEAAGMAPDEARRDAEQRFGDTGRVLAECRAIQMKERIMLQRINAILIVLLLAGTVANLWVGAHAQERVQDDVADLRESVAALTAGLGGLVPGDLAERVVTDDRMVHVLGSVRQPGLIAWRENLTLTRLISYAGDFENFADESKIKVIREKPSGREVTIVDFNEILAGNRPDFPLEVDDLVVVSEAIF